MEALQLKKTGNMELHYDKNLAIINIDIGIFSMEVIDAASDLMKGKAEIKINKNHEGKAELHLNPKGKNENIEKLGREFNNKLVNCLAGDIKENSKIADNLDILEQSFLEDSLGISKLWSE